MKRQALWQKMWKHALLLFFCFLIIAPFMLVLVNSFKSKGEAARINLALPSEWHFENYAQVIREGKLLQGFTNSIIYAGGSSLVAVVIASMASFVLARKKSKAMEFLYYFFICGLFLPVNYVTLSKLFQTLHMTSGRVSLLVTFISSMLPFCVFIIRNYVSTIPAEIDEAAMIDGAGPLQLFFRIILPLLQPIIVTAFILQFMGVWSDFITPLYLTSKSALWPMNLAVYNFFGKNSSHWNLVFADIVLTILPVIVVYLLGQKYILEGITAGSVKG